MSKVQFFDVSGKILVPGTRTVITVGPIRVVAHSLTKAATDLIPVIARSIREKHRTPKGKPEPVITAQFLQMNLRFVQFDVGA